MKNEREKKMMKMISVDISEGGRRGRRAISERKGVKEK